MITKLDIDKELTFEEIKHLLSKTDEFSIKKQPNKILKLTLKCTVSVGRSGNKPIYEYAYLDTLIYKPTLQTLIRDISGLGWRKHSEVDGLTQK